MAQRKSNEIVIAALMWFMVFIVMLVTREPDASILGIALASFLVMLALVVALIFIGVVVKYIVMPVLTAFQKH